MTINKKIEPQEHFNICRILSNQAYCDTMMDPMTDDLTQNTGNSLGQYLT